MNDLMAGEKCVCIYVYLEFVKFQVHINALTKGGYMSKYQDIAYMEYEHKAIALFWTCT